MLRAESTICGTTTTGTGNLTLATCPGPPGGVDLFAAFTGQGLGTTKEVPVAYTIVEYTDATFQTAKQIEVGIGDLLLGANIGATTLKRATGNGVVQITATGLNATPTYNVGTISAGALTPPTAITIGTAANTLVFIGASASHLLAAASATGAHDTTLSRDGWGIPADQASTTPSSQTLVNQTIYYSLLELKTPLLASKMRLKTGASTYTGQNNNAYGALYALDKNGFPGKLLADFSFFGTQNQLWVAANTMVATGALATPIMLLPGFYWAAVHPIWTAAGTGTPGTIFGSAASNRNFHTQQVAGTKSGQAVTALTETGNATAGFADFAATPSTAETPNSLSQPVLFVGR